MARFNKFPFIILILCLLVFQDSKKACDVLELLSSSEDSSEALCGLWAVRKNVLF